MMVLKFSSKMLLAVLVSGCAAAAAQAAEPLAQMSHIKGKVLVDAGAGFAQPLRNSQLHAGDRVFIGKGAQLVLNYQLENCAVRYDHPAVLVMDSKTHCKSGENLVAEQTAFVTPAADVVGDPGMMVPHGNYAAGAAGGLAPVLLGTSVEALAVIVAATSALTTTPVSAP